MSFIHNLSIYKKILFIVLMSTFGSVLTLTYTYVNTDQNDERLSRVTTIHFPVLEA